MRRASNSPPSSAVTSLAEEGYAVVRAELPQSRHFQFLVAAPAGVVTSSEWVTDRVATHQTEQLRKTWDATPYPSGSRTFLRSFRSTVAAKECAAVVLKTLTTHGVCDDSHTVPHGNLTLLQNEPDAPEQMLHYDIHRDFRNHTVTVVCAFCEPFALRIVHRVTRDELLVLVPHGSMCVLGGWCFHGGASASASGGGTGARVFGMARRTLDTTARPGNYHE